MTRTPEQMLIEAVLNDFAAAEYPGMQLDDVFERFAVVQLRKPLEMTQEEIEAGVVDGKQDGGVDTFYVFVNGVLIREDDPILVPTSEAHKKLARNPRVEVLMVQAKNQEVWKEYVWEKVAATLKDVMDAGRPDAELELIYNSKLVEVTGLLRRALQVLATKFPKIVFRAVYAARGPEANISQTITERAGQAAHVISGALPGDADIRVETLGAESLYSLAAQPVGEPGTLRFRELVRESSSYVGVVSISDYLDFVRDSATGSIREQLFEANVRDFAGDNRVNAAIAETVAVEDSAEFWWLNNGVTILGDEVSGAQKTLTISRPLVVNGLQTSHVLHHAEAEGALHASRLLHGIVVRVIESTDEAVRDRIIEGTNRQTPVGGAALFATNQQQMRLEAYLKLKGIYYERRRNRYKNQGVSADRRVSMSQLAQAMITVLLGEPDQARARPSSLLTRPGGYNQVFPESLELDAYVKAVRLLGEINAYLRTPRAKAILDDPSNARFYLLAGYLMGATKAKSFSRVNFALAFRRIGTPVDADRLDAALVALERTARLYQSRHQDLSRDAIFKSADFRSKYFDALGRSIARRKMP